MAEVLVIRSYAIIKHWSIILFIFTLVEQIKEKQIIKEYLWYKIMAYISLNFQVALNTLTLTLDQIVYMSRKRGLLIKSFNISNLFCRFIDLINLIFW
jgi:hypothetical protein